MFSRSLLKTASGPTNIRTMTTSRLIPTRYSNYVLPALGVAASVAAFYSYSTYQSKLQAESKRALTGDGSWVDFKVKESVDLSANTKKITFELPEGAVLGTEVASCIFTKITGSNGKPIIRPYTPTTSPDTVGYFDLVVKVYPDGKLSPHIHSLKPGDTLPFKGPILKYKWTPNKHTEIALIGGGTGITPLFQLLQEIESKPEDKTKVNLIYASVSEKDILIKKDIDELVAKRPDQFKVTYFVDKPTDSWKGETGYISKDFLEKSLFKPSADNVKIFVCGPPPLYDAISGNKVSPKDQGELKGALKDLGFDKDQVFKF